MEPEPFKEDLVDEGEASAAEQFLLVAVRVASLPLLALVLVMAASLYGVIGLGHQAGRMIPRVADAAKGRPIGSRNA